MCVMITCVYMRTYSASHYVYYGVATMIRLIEIIGLFCRIQSLL